VKTKRSRPKLTPTISLCVIARDEERFIGDCIDSAKPFVQEIVVLDTGSQDRTREIAIRIARESGNDYLPELEAVASDELGTLFAYPPSVTGLSVGKVINNTFRFLGSVRSGEVFYVFARLDPYEQAELKEKGTATFQVAPRSGNTKQAESKTRPRRVAHP